MRLSADRASVVPFLCAVLSFSLILIITPWLQSTAAAPESDVLEVKAESGGGVHATAHLTFPARPDVIQSMLTDYPHWPELFDVRMRMADITIHEGVAKTDIRIEHALLPGERRLVTESRALPEGGMITDLVGGDFKKYRRVWKLTPVNGGTQTRADFELVVAIDSVVPDWLVAFAMRRELEAHFRIVKKKALAGTKPEK